MPSVNQRGTRWFDICSVIDVRELVPERRLPREGAGRLGLGRVHADDAAEARAEGADEPWQTEVADREVVVNRKDLDEDRSLRRELVVRRHLLERVLGERDGVLAQDARLGGVELEDQIAVLHDLELLELVEEREQVEGHLVERKRLERGVEHAARFDLVARAHQMQAEIALRANVRRRELDGPPGQDHGFVEAIVARGHFARNPVGLAKVRVDGQDARELGVEGRLVVADVGDAAEEGAGIEMRRVVLEHAVDALARGVVARVVELESGEEEVRIGQIGVDLERLLGRRRGLRRVLARERARDPDVRRGPVAGLLEDLLKRLQCFGGIVGLEEEFAPRDFDCGVRAASRHAIEGVRVLHPAQRLRRARGAEHGLAVGDLQTSPDNAAEVRRRRPRPARSGA